VASAAEPSRTVVSAPAVVDGTVESVTSPALLVAEVATQ
jgi:hypothetical protein